MSLAFTVQKASNMYMKGRAIAHNIRLNNGLIVKFFGFDRKDETIHDAIHRRDTEVEMHKLAHRACPAFVTTPIDVVGPHYRLSFAGAIHDIGTYSVQTKAYGVLIDDLIAQGRDDLKPKIRAKIIDALACLHGHRIYHGDIKGNNVLYDEHQDKLTLIDFGLSHRSCEPSPVSNEYPCHNTRFLQPGTLVNNKYMEHATLREWLQLKPLDIYGPLYKPVINNDGHQHVGRTRMLAGRLARIRALQSSVGI